MRVIVATVVSIWLTAVSAFYVFSYEPTSAPVPVAEVPKQSYHVVYFWSCNLLVGTLLTTDPVIWNSVEDGLPDREIIDMMIAMEGTDRVISVRHWHPGCFNLAPITPPRIES